MLRHTSRSILAALTSLALLGACTEAPQAPGRDGTLNVSANLSATSVAMVVVVVTAADIPSPLTFNLTIVSGVASGTITIPAGSNRTITMHAYDANGVETHNGAVTANIASGTNATISLLLTPLTGDAPVTVTLGSITVTVTPSPATVAVGATVSLTAALTSNGNPVAGIVTWATTNPGVATVATNGVVTGVSAGQTSIVATYQGVAGASTVTVTGP
jgi:uncharacterized protein YjdB